MTRCCEVCKQPISDGDVREVVLRNKLIVKACSRCWFMWPDDWKVFEAHRLLSA